MVYKYVILRATSGHYVFHAARETLTEAREYVMKSKRPKWLYIFKFVEAPMTDL